MFQKIFKFVDFFIDRLYHQSTRIEDMFCCIYITLTPDSSGNRHPHTGNGLLPSGNLPCVEHPDRPLRGAVVAFLYSRLPGAATVERPHLAAVSPDGLNLFHVRTGVLHRSIALAAAGDCISFKQLCGYCF